MDAYQAIYDATRSKICNGDIGEAVQGALRDANLSHYAQMAGNAIVEATGEYNRPSAVWRPKLTIAGDHWCALYGTDLQEGVAGFGKSPEAAMRAFDVAWYKTLEPKAARRAAAAGSADETGESKSGAGSESDKHSEPAEGTRNQHDQ